MDSSEPRRLAALPGYDSAPDVYETADSIDDISSATLQTSPRSLTEESETSEEEDEESYGVSRRRLYPERARSRFDATSSRVETKNVDLSDRVDGRRKGYGVRRRGWEHEVDEEEALEARIARLRREIEECKAEAQRRRETGAAGEEEHEDLVPYVDELPQLLAGIELSGARAGQGPEIRQRQATNGPPAPSTTKLEEKEEELSHEQTLAKVAGFDSRLAVLEQSLGISSLDSATADAVSAPVLPSLAFLDQQLSALASSSSLTALEVASSRIQKLKSDAEHLAQIQVRSHEAVDGEEAGSEGALTHSDITQLQSLCTLLPTLQSLAPTVPLILGRLRSMRALHTSAASAAEELDDVEKRQAEMDKELAAWTTGLEQVERAVSEASEANGRNGKVVEAWVRELESRMKALGR